MPARYHDLSMITAVRLMTFRIRIHKTMIRTRSNNVTPARASSFTWTGRGASCLAILVGLCILSGLADAQSGWTSAGGPLGGPLNVITQWDDGTGPALYLGGGIVGAGSVLSLGVVRWDGANWSSLGGGLNLSIPGTQLFIPIVNALVVHDDGSGAGLYAGGYFWSAGMIWSPGIAHWSGSTWSNVGGGMTGANSNWAPQVRALASFDAGNGPSLYATGDFVTVGGTAFPGFARWNGTTWTGVGNVSGSANCLAVGDLGSGRRLFAGFGGSVTIGAAQNVKVAAWDGAQWTVLRTATTGGSGEGIWDLEIFDDGTGPALYAVSSVSPASRVLKLSSGAWSQVGTLVAGTQGSSPSIGDLTVVDLGAGPRLVANTSGTVSYGGGNGTGPVAWNGTAWSWVHNASTALIDGGKAVGPFVRPGVTELCAAGAITGASLPGLGYYSMVRATVPPGPSFKGTQPAGPGGPLHLTHSNLFPGREYMNIFSTDLCPGPAGSGPNLGLCFVSVPNLQFLAWQLTQPLGSSPLHFSAPADHVTWPSMVVPPITLDGVIVDITGGIIGDVSPVLRLTIQ